MKYFSQNYISSEAITWLKQSRKQLISGKEVYFGNGEVVEIYEFEKPMYIKLKDCPLLEEIETLVEGDLNWSDLSPALRTYIKSKDELFFSKAYQKWKKRELYERMRIESHIENLEKHYERELSIEEFEKIYSGEKIQIPTTLKKKVTDSTRRTYKTVNDYIKANLDRFDVFATLTFARKENIDSYNDYPFQFVDDTKDLEQVSKAFTKFMDNLKKKLRRQNKELYYMAVYERHKDGSYHFHIMLNDIGENNLIKCPEWLDIDYKTKQRRNGLMFRDWNYGKSDYDVIKDKERMASYLCKYLTKTIKNLTNEQSYETLLSKKRFYNSKNLRKPKVKYYDDAIELNKTKEHKKSSYADTYEKKYVNPYNSGEIIKTVFSKEIIH